MGIQKGKIFIFPLAAFLAYNAMTFLSDFVIVDGIQRQRRTGTVASSSLRPGQGGTSSSTTSTTTITSNDRPPIYTFYEKVEQGEDNLLQEWRAAWYAAGLAPVVLGMDEARRHPHFVEADRAISQIFGHGYDGLCFFRWFAMAVAAAENGTGGGWMVDYDTFPLHFPPSLVVSRSSGTSSGSSGTTSSTMTNHHAGWPNGGRLTIFENVVPCLVAASTSEWDRVAQLLVDQLGRDDLGLDLPSDMYVLESLQKRGDSGIVFMEPGKYVRVGFDYTTATPRHMDCETIGDEALAAHLSHRYVREAVRDGIFPVDTIHDEDGALRNRGEAARRYIEDFREQCLQQQEQSEQSQSEQSEQPLMLLADMKMDTLLHQPMVSTEDDEDGSSSGSGSGSTTGRPQIHTFYEKVHQGEDNLLNQWKAAWSDAGFDPVVLTMDDARQHPDFDRIDKVISKTFGHSYNGLCFFRWFAMAMTAHGGWMVDYDTFPLLLDYPKRGTSLDFFDTRQLPNDGQLTSYENVVPCMVAASKPEWDRVAQLLVATLDEITTSGTNSDIELPSDMYLLDELKNRGHSDILFMEPGKYVRVGFDYKAPRQVDCEALGDDALSTHLAHRYVREALEQGIFPLETVRTKDEAFESRGEAARIYIRDVHEQCSGTSVVSEKDSEAEVEPKPEPEPPVVVDPNEHEHEHEKGDGRPKIYTFYEKVEQGEDNLLDQWKAVWSDAGFDPVVLTMDDARRHANFDDMDRHITAKFAQDAYNGLCFFRWIAMATRTNEDGGGWMVDYDTFPLHFDPAVAAVPNLPHDGQLTSFENVVPCLVAASTAEWDRVAQLLVDQLSRDDLELDLPSDMYVLDALKRQGDSDIRFMEPGTYVRVGFDYTAPHRVHCDAIGPEALVTHLSHRYVHEALDDGLFPVDEITRVDDALQHRGEAARIYIDDWRRQCPRSPPPEETNEEPTEEKASSPSVK